MTGEQRMEAALKPFGWEMGPEFWQRYYSDPWVFNLANAVERLHVALVEVECHCPCGARPESLNTHPHVIGCPVARALHSRTVADSYNEAVR